MDAPCRLLPGATGDDDCWREARGPEEGAIYWATFATVAALAVQALFFVLRWRPAERWWRVGAAFAGMMFFLSTPVWEGYPGASTRVLLPMTLAFNVLVPRTGRWLPILLAGNLTVRGVSVPNISLLRIDIRVLE